MKYLKRYNENLRERRGDPQLLPTTTDLEQIIKDNLEMEDKLFDLVEVTIKDDIDGYTYDCKLVENFSNNEEVMDAVKIYNACADDVIEARREHELEPYYTKSQDVEEAERIERHRHQNILDIIYRINKSVFKTLGKKYDFEVYLMTVTNAHGFNNIDNSADLQLYIKHNDYKGDAKDLK